VETVRRATVKARLTLAGIKTRIEQEVTEVKGDPDFQRARQLF
jgi:hypothetical protein